MNKKRLTPGQLAATSESRREARRLFLRTLAECCPYVAAGLRDEVLPVYVSLYCEIAARSDLAVLKADQERYLQADGDSIRLCTDPSRLTTWKTVGASMRGGNVTMYPDVQPLREALERWVPERLREAAWLYDIALAQLDLWRQRPELASQGEIFCVPRAPRRATVAEEHVLVLKLDEVAVYDPTLELRSVAKARIRALFASELDNYLSAVEAEFADDFSRSKWYDDLQTPMRWLVLHRVDGRTPDEICKLELKLRPEWEAEDPIGTVTRAITRTASLLALPDRPGRPAKP